MTRSFLKRAALAAVIVVPGFVAVTGDPSPYRRFIADWNSIQVAIVLATLSAGWCALVLWVVAALFKKSGDRTRGKSAAVLAVVSAGCLAGQPAHALSLVVAGPNTVITTNNGTFTISAVKIEQPFALAPDLQRQVDEAIADASRDARNAPGFVMTVELAIGIAIAAVLVGSVLYIVVRMICQSLDQMKLDLSNRLSKLKGFLENPKQTNTPTVIGAGIFRHRPATTDDLPVGKELVVGFTAPEPDQPPTLTGEMGDAQTISFNEFLDSLGLPHSIAQDTTVGRGVSRIDGGYQVSPPGFTDLVTLGFEATSNLAQNSWRKILTLKVPVGAILDVSDLCGRSDGRYWRVGVAP